MMMMTVATETSVALTILFSQMKIIWLFWVLCHEVHSQWRMRIQDLDFGEGKSWGQVGAIFYRSGTRQCPYQEFFFILGCRNAYFGALSDPSECVCICAVIRPGPDLQFACPTRLTVDQRRWSSCRRGHWTLYVTNLGLIIANVKTLRHERWQRECATHNILQRRHSPWLPSPSVWICHCVWYTIQTAFPHLCADASVTSASHFRPMIFCLACSALRRLEIKHGLVQLCRRYDVL